MGAAKRCLRHVVHAAVCSVALFLGMAIAPAHAETAAKPVKIVALGDSLTAGLGLPQSEGFVPRLQAALAAKGLAAEVINAGVSGDTASDVLARLDWSVPEDTDAVILEIGANDMLRGIKPQVTRAAVDTILQQLTGAAHRRAVVRHARGAKSWAPIMRQRSRAFIPSLPPNMAFCSIRSSSTASRPISAVCSGTACIQTPRASRSMVAAILPKVEQLIALVRDRRSS